MSASLRGMLFDLNSLDVVRVIEELGNETSNCTVEGI